MSVIQHLPNKYKQLQALRELIRVSKKGGRILIYVWSFEKANMKPRFEDPSQYQFLTWKLPLSSIGGKRDSIERDGFIVNEEENTVEPAEELLSFEVNGSNLETLVGMLDPGMTKEQFLMYLVSLEFISFLSVTLGT